MFTGTFSGQRDLGALRRWGDDNCLGISSEARKTWLENDQVTFLCVPGSKYLEGRGRAAGRKSTCFRTKVSPDEVAPNLVEFVAEVEEVANIVGNWPNSPDIGRVRPKFGRNQSMLTKVGPIGAKINPNWATSPKWAEFGHNFSQWARVLTGQAPSPGT